MSSETKKVAFHTLGCKLNYAETSTIARQFVGAGYEKTEFGNPADLYVINTCSVTENADKEFRKIVNKAKRQSPDSKIAVIGCYAQLKPEFIVESSAVDLVLGTREKFNLLQHIQFQDETHTPQIIQDTELDEIHGCIPSYSIGDRTRSFLKIQDGCDYPCTYCTIPLARGRSRSLEPTAIVQQAKEIASGGVKEIVLTGVNVGDYRYSDDIVLFDLLKRLDEIEGIERIRISSIEPNLLTDPIIEFIPKSRTILPHLHIPLQSGSDKILGLMKRRYHVDVFTDRINTIRSIMPEAGIGVDVIVGFPGEGEQEFMETYDLLESLDISYLHVFTYSERPNTAAIEMPNPVGVPQRKDRNKRLTELSDKKNLSFALRQINSTSRVLFETQREGQLTGMTENYLKIYVPSHSSDLLNTTAAVEITGMTENKLMGRV